MINFLIEREVEYNVLMLNLVNIDKSVYVLFLLFIYVMVIFVIKDRIFIYWIFFDFNNGVKVYDNYVEFKCYVDKLLIKEGYFN